MVKKINDIKELGAGTVILFTIKGFIGAVVTLAGILFGFYTTVLEPRVQAVESQYKTSIELEQKNTEQITTELNAINKSIFAIRLNVQKLQLKKGLSSVSEEQSEVLFNQNIIKGDTTRYMDLKEIDDFYPSALVAPKKAD